MTKLSRYPISVTLETPASFSEAPAMGNNSRTLEYIPGSALRGMLANLFLEKQKPDSKFRRLFVDDAVRFSNLHPENSRRLPLSAYSCKYHAGFKQDRLPAYMVRAHGVVDRIWEDFFLSTASPEAQPADKQAQKDCWEPDCRHPITLLENSFYYSGAKLKTNLPKKITRLSTAVLGSSGSARQGSLHSLEELAAGQAFHGYLIADPGDFSALTGVLGTEFEGYLGRRRACLAKIVLNPYDTKWDEPFVFSHPQHLETRYAVLTCLSDLILVDEFLQPVAVLTTENIPGLLDPPGGVEVQVHKAFASSWMVAGWLAVGKLFKENDLAISSGSTFLLGFSTNSEAPMMKWMQTLEKSGLGLRRSEGFGQITFSEPLHAQSWERMDRYMKNPGTEDFRL